MNQYLCLFVSRVFSASSQLNKISSEFSSSKNNALYGRTKYIYSDEIFGKIDFAENGHTNYKNGTNGPIFNSSQEIKMEQIQDKNIDFENIQDDDATRETIKNNNSVKILNQDNADKKVESEIKAPILFNLMSENYNFLEIEMTAILIDPIPLPTQQTVGVFNNTADLLSNVNFIENNKSQNINLKGLTLRLRPYLINLYLLVMNPISIQKNKAIPSVRTYLQKCVESMIKDYNNFVNDATINTDKKYQSLYESTKNQLMKSMEKYYLISSNTININVDCFVPNFITSSNLLNSMFTKAFQYNIYQSNTQKTRLEIKYYKDLACFFKLEIYKINIEIRSGMNTSNYEYEDPKDIRYINIMAQFLERATTKITRGMHKWSNNEYIMFVGIQKLLTNKTSYYLDIATPEKKYDLLLMVGLMFGIDEQNKLQVHLNNFILIENIRCVRAVQPTNNIPQNQFTLDGSFNKSPCLDIHSDFRLLNEIEEYCMHVNLNGTKKRFLTNIGMEILAFFEDNNSLKLNISECSLINFFKQCERINEYVNHFGIMFRDRLKIFIVSCLKSRLKIIKRAFLKVQNQLEKLNNNLAENVRLFKNGKMSESQYKENFNRQQIILKKISVIKLDFGLNVLYLKMLFKLVK